MGRIDTKAEKDVIIDEDLLLKNIVCIQGLHVPLNYFDGSNLGALDKIVINFLYSSLSLYLLE
jgi:hypothetical protein